MDESVQAASPPPYPPPYRGRGLAAYVLLISVYLSIGGGFLFGNVSLSYAQVFASRDGMLSRDITIAQYKNGLVVETWPWVDYGFYYESLLQMAYDPVLPPSRWGVIPDLPDRMVVTERAQNGQLLRRFQVTDENYVYTYQTYAYSYKRDLGKFSKLLQDVFKSLPEDYLTPKNRVDDLPPFTILIQDLNAVESRPVLDGASFLPQFAEMLRMNLKESRPLQALEEINMNNNFKGPGTIQVLIRGDQSDLPDEIMIKDGQIRIRESTAVTRGYVDRLGWRAHAMDQRRLYQEWKSRGGITPPRVR